VGRFENAIDLLTEIISANQAGFGGRAMIYSRAGQFEKAEEDIARQRLSNVSTTFLQLIQLYWQGKRDALEGTFSRTEFDKQGLLWKVWISFLVGDIEGGMGYLEEDVSRGAHPAVFRSNIGEVVSKTLLQDIEQHPRYQAILKRFGIDDAWRDELTALANELTVVTGIHVRPDGAY